MEPRKLLSPAPISVYSSLTRTKTPFIPIDPSGKKVTWYCCGPTVYDAGHLGHARNYVSTDVLRRIMRDYFGYDVVFVQNVTDVDDKIINRARERHFFKKYVQEHPVVDRQVLQDIREAFNWYGQRTATFPTDLEPSGFSQWLDSHSSLFERQTLSEDEIIFKNRLNALSATASVLLSAEQEGADPESFYHSVDGVFSLYLGDVHKASISGDEHAIFADYARFWENHFNADMRALNVLPPTITTRVSEFIPQNIAFVQRIIDNGFGYAVPGGTVYFDIGAYERAGHSYPQLEPGMKDNEVEEEEPEATVTDGDDVLLSSADREKAAEKRLKKNRRDFALWKKSRTGEPSWDSPWGPGRPGWHIECSAMCSEVLGSRVDIHSGGIDLAFPHHDNELAQSEAFWHHEHLALEEQDGIRGWIKYFLHMGHLSIAGSKMSKSLKNFVTIRHALESGEWTPRRLRIVFMMGGWKNGIEISPGMKKMVEIWESTLNNFFVSVRALLAEEAELEKAGSSSAHLFRSQERQLYDDLEKAQAAMHTALSDSFNTPVALDVIADIVSKTNTYLAANQKTPANPDAYFSLTALREIARWVTRMVEIFGLEPLAGGDRIGWSTDDRQSTAGAGQAANAEEVATPYVRVLSRFRDRVKQLALSDPNASISKELLALSDTIRDDELIPLGVSLEDRNSAVGEPALVKFAPATELIAAREEKTRAIREKAARKEEAQLEAARLERDKADKAKVAPSDMFKTAEYTEWDADGLPTVDANGVEVTKSKKKTLQKAWDKQKRLYEAWLTTQST